MPSTEVQEHPTCAEAEAALQALREQFGTFPFADANRRFDNGLEVDVTDLGDPPGHDESAFLVGLLTAVCRPSLCLAPGLLIRAPEISGPGTGKGLLVRAISVNAYGSQPYAFTKGSDISELDSALPRTCSRQSQSFFSTTSTVLC